jgi:iron-sulfur cluster repair protein YtfE (RIC family)
VLERVVEAAMLDDWTRAATAFRTFERGLRAHIRAEEDLLFPAFEAAVGGATAPVQVMKAEHRRIEGLLGEIGHNLEEEAPIEELVDALRTVVGTHNQKEEQVLYPACDQAVPEAERARVLEASRGLLGER